MIYVTGANGQLGNELKKKLGSNAVFLTREMLDLQNHASVENFLKTTEIELLINAGAYTQVDKAEEEREVSASINEITPKIMARYSREKKFKFIHFSTDYVFNGTGPTPYKESDNTDPVNFYGETKLRGEKAILEENPHSLVIRTSWVYSAFGKNFIKTILKFGSERDSLNVVYDQIGSLTNAGDLAEVTLKARELSGIYHFSNEGVSSWYDVAFELKKQKKFKASISPILSHQYPTPAKRPHYSVLDKAKIKNALGIQIPHWTESLSLCLKELS
jgi:dTDP-4-dehydrorhamnose reductase